MLRALSSLQLSVALATPVMAQLAPQPSAQLPIAQGREVWVARRNHPTIHGTVFAVTPRAIEILTDTALVEIPIRDVVKVQVPGPPATKSGAVLGGIIGGVTMASMVAIGGSQCDERNEIVCTSGPAWTIGGGAVGAVLGALTGATIGSRMRTP
ncbi:MAG TPA: hypothetical protein VFO19_01985 [Vicinamibacterales bacterium]|nr:hypothetical protein [Vicinamibacterales bacterium]